MTDVMAAGPSDHDEANDSNASSRFEEEDWRADAEEGDADVAGEADESSPLEQGEAPVSMQDLMLGAGNEEEGAEDDRHEGSEEPAAQAEAPTAAAVDNSSNHSDTTHTHGGGSMSPMTAALERDAEERVATAPQQLSQQQQQQPTSGRRFRKAPHTKTFRLETVTPMPPEQPQGRSNPRGAASARPPPNVSPTNGSRFRTPPQRGSRSSRDASGSTRSARGGEAAVVVSLPPIGRGVSANLKAPEMIARRPFRRGVRSCSPEDPGRPSRVLSPRRQPADGTKVVYVASPRQPNQQQQDGPLSDGTLTSATGRSEGGGGGGACALPPIHKTTVQPLSATVIGDYNGTDNWGTLTSAGSLMEHIQQSPLRHDQARLHANGPQNMHIAGNKDTVFCYPYPEWLKQSLTAAGDKRSAPHQQKRSPRTGQQGDGGATANGAGGGQQQQQQQQRNPRSAALIAANNNNNNTTSQGAGGAPRRSQALAPVPPKASQQRDIATVFASDKEQKQSIALRQYAQQHTPAPPRPIPVSADSSVRAQAYAHRLLRVMDGVVPEHAVRVAAEKRSTAVARENKRNLHQLGDVTPLVFDYIPPKRPTLQAGGDNENNEQLVIMPPPLSDSPRKDDEQAVAAETVRSLAIIAAAMDAVAAEAQLPPPRQQQQQADSSDSILEEVTLVRQCLFQIAEAFDTAAPIVAMPPPTLHSARAVNAGKGLSRPDDVSIEVIAQRAMSYENASRAEATRSVLLTIATALDRYPAWKQAPASSPPSPPPEQPMAAHDHHHVEEEERAAVVVAPPSSADKAYDPEAHAIARGWFSHDVFDVAAWRFAHAQEGLAREVVADAVESAVQAAKNLHPAGAAASLTEALRYRPVAETSSVSQEEDEKDVDEIPQRAAPAVASSTSSDAAKASTTPAPAASTSGVSAKTRAIPQHEKVSHSQQQQQQHRPETDTASATSDYDAVVKLEASLFVATVMEAALQASSSSSFSHM